MSSQFAVELLRGDTQRSDEISRNEIGSVCQSVGQVMPGSTVAFNRIELSYLEGVVVCVSSSR
jgi:hypothetical protein